MQIKLKRDWNGYKAGATVGVSDDRGLHLHEQGIAEIDPAYLKSLPAQDAPSNKMVTGARKGGGRK